MSAGPKARAMGFTASLLAWMFAQAPLLGRGWLTGR
jgi:hypothetical protein